MLGKKVCHLSPFSRHFLFLSIRFFYLISFNLLKEHFPNYQNHCMHTCICRHAFMCIACICMCICMYMYVCVYNMFSIHRSCFYLIFIQLWTGMKTVIMAVPVPQFPLLLVIFYYIMYYM